MNITPNPTASALQFAAPDLLETLESADCLALDSAPFGIVAMNHNGEVQFYNRYESHLSGLSPQKVMGRRFFRDVAPCSNVPEVAGRFQAEPELDEMVNYMFAFAMRPTPVRLRLLKSPGIDQHYLLVERR